jgi:dolichol-phosphate mannosyltransferase
MIMNELAMAPLLEPAVSDNCALIMASWDDSKVLNVLRQFDRPYVKEIVLILDEPRSTLLVHLQELKSKLAMPLKIIVNDRRMGVGFGIRQALKYCQDSGKKFVVLMACNGKDNPSEIPRFTRALAKGVDYVQGSRFVRGGKAIRTPFLRAGFSRMWPLFWSLLVGRRVTEVTNGFRAYDIRILLDKRIRLDQRWLDRYALEYYLHFKVLFYGYRYCEVPVTKTYPWSHKGGYSKIRPLRDWKDILLTPVLLRLGVYR